ncbi:MAG: nitroreductase family protein [Acidobacteriota bacterium]
MDAIECLITRRSVRDFSEKEVEDKEIMEILKCAMFAPSAGNQRPWHFIVIRDKETMSKITQFHPHAAMLKTAKVAIAVIADTTAEKHQGYWVQDCSACVQNILLSAHALGVGSVWLGIYPREERMKGLSGLLNLPENTIPFAVVAIGYPAKKIEQPERFDKTRIHFEKW